MWRERNSRSRSECSERGERGSPATCAGFVVIHLRTTIVTAPSRKGLKRPFTGAITVDGYFVFKVNLVVFIF